MINPNYQNSGFGGSVPGRSESNNQKALRVIQDAVSTPGYYGFTFPAGAPATPNETDVIVIYLAHFDDIQGGGWNTAKKKNEIRRKIGHEVGHGIHVCHREGQCPDGAAVGGNTSIMSTPILGTPVGDAASKYNSFDVPQIRLHQRF